MKLRTVFIILGLLALLMIAAFYLDYQNGAKGKPNEDQKNWGKTYPSLANLLSRSVPDSEFTGAPLKDRTLDVVRSCTLTVGPASGRLAKMARTVKFDFVTGRATFTYAPDPKDAQYYEPGDNSDPSDPTKTKFKIMENGGTFNIVALPPTSRCQLRIE